MATGVLGNVDLAATTYTIVYTAPASKQAVCNINVCNRTAGAVTVRIAVTTSLTPAASDFVVYDHTIGANNPLEIKGIVLQYGFSIVAYSSSASVNVMAWGYEESQ